MRARQLKWTLALGSMSLELNEKWRPSASIENLRLRAQILAKIRDFFADRQVMEVETPAIGRYTTTDRHIKSIVIHDSQQGDYYLQTSPEFAMKRLLAANSGDIYQICKSFRAQEQGSKHNPEFTMLEWYRLGFDHHQLMNEVDELICLVLNTAPALKISYRQLFLQFCKLDIDDCEDEVLQNQIQERGWMSSAASLDRDTCLQLLMSHCIEPHLGFQSPVLVIDFPKTQAALARLSQTIPPVAERFELYICGNEIANGFHELTDIAEQKSRFLQDQQQRRDNNDPVPQMDPRFLAALQHGLPHCAGVALGIDRLVMLATKSQHINEVLSFPWDRC